MTKLSPTISVVMSVYNNAAFLREAVESILHQTFTDFEFLIMDDGSTDRSLSILQEYAEQDARVVVFSRENRGLTCTLNELIGYARAEFIARMDADDVSLPDRFARQVEFLRQHPQVVCVGGAQNWIDDAGRILEHRQEAETDAEIQQQNLSGCTAINHPSSMMRRSAILQVGGYDETLWSAQDLDLWLKLGEVGELANLKETVLQYRQHMSSVSESRQAEQLRNKQRACERAWQRRGITGTFKESEPWRPVDRPSRYQFMLRYGWQFFNRGQRYAAIVYGLRSIKALPTAVEGWKLLVCALIKPLPQPHSL